MNTRGIGVPPVCLRNLGLACRATGLAAILALFSGCGWSPRDTHLAHQKVTVQPQPGDGSTRFSRIPEDPFKAQTGTAAADLSNH
jgi:hypothetical protein